MPANGNNADLVVSPESLLVGLYVMFSVHFLVADDAMSFLLLEALSAIISNKRDVCYNEN